MANLSDIGLGAFISDILTGLGDGLIAIAPGLIVLAIGVALGTGMTVLLRNVFSKTSK